MDHMSDKVDHMQAFLQLKFPGDYCVNELVAPQNDVVSTWAFSFHSSEMIEKY
jgi:hypothetical protein